MTERPRLLINLPAGFFRTASLEPLWARLAERADCVRASHDTAEQIVGDLEGADAVLMWSWPALTDVLLDRAPRLRYLAHLDLTQRAARAALARGLPVSVSRSGFSPAVAEMALALILGVYRRTGEYHTAMRDGTEEWVRSFPDDIDARERELSGRPVGIIGFGRVGRRLRELLRPFGGRVLVFDPYLAPSDAVAANVDAAPLESLLASSDVVVLCAASNEGTRRLLGPDEIGRLRSGAVFVNVARAALVDTEPLVARLRTGDISAAIDVFDAEPLSPDNPLRALPNCYLTPHRAGGTLASVVRIIEFLVTDLEAFWSGGPSLHPLTEAMIPSLDA